MKEDLIRRAQEIITIINQIPNVKNCTLYGSLAENRDDSLSDIDIEVDISGMDNGVFALLLPELVKQKMQVFYTDYAPSLAPEQYVVSIALDEENPFLIADIRCRAYPHYGTISKEQLKDQNDPYTHMLKLWTINLKHFARDDDCSDDIHRMAAKVGIQEQRKKDKAELLMEVLHWLESNAPEHLSCFVKSCRREAERIDSEIDIYPKAN
ncbi:MAG: hypothetical protein J6K55_01105 [Clostridia bacterium]|nr:hypothetical protein [Clostridia bacterium]